MQTHDFVRFLDGSVSSFHAAQLTAARLAERGFRQLELRDSWNISSGDRVYVEHGGSVVAIRVGRATPAESGAIIAAAHTDSPSPQLKPRSATVADGLLQVPVEVYGGPILATWLDRELGVAGRIVAVDGEGTPRVHQVAIRRAMAVIPNLAIHLNREVNDGVSYNRQDHLRAVFGPAANPPDGDPESDENSPTPEQQLYDRIADAAGVDADTIVDTELYLVPTAPATVLGGDDGLVVSPRIDNLAGCYAVAEAIAAADPSADHTQVAVFFNHEEIGSATSVGAAGALLESVLRRVVAALDVAPDAWDRTVARSVLLSNDAAHARHPNYPEKHDPGYAPRLGGGPVVKKSAIWRYVADLDISGWFAAVCRDAEVPLQYLQNRSDIRAGSTIGPAVAARLGVRGVDIGIPMLAMHSVRETAAVADVANMIVALTRAYGSSLP